MRVTPTINIPLEAESIHFLGIYIVGIILFGIGYCLTVFCVSKKIKVELTKPINLLKEAMKELGSGNYKKDYLLKQSMNLWRWQILLIVWRKKWKML